VYGNSAKVILDSDGSGNLMYLPLDKLMESGRIGSGTDRSRSPATDSDADQGSEYTTEEDRRERRTRQ